MNKKVVLSIILGLTVMGTGVGAFLLLRKKNSLNVQSVGEVGSVVSDKLPVENIVSQKIVNEAIVTRTLGGNTIVEKETSKPILIRNPITYNKPIPNRVPYVPGRISESRKFATARDALNKIDSVPFFTRMAL